MLVWITVMVQIVCFLKGSTSSLSVCGLGKRAVATTGDVKNICDPCPSETYMDEDYHQHFNCKPCSTIVDKNTEIIVKNCTLISDALIWCRSEFFRVNKTRIPEQDTCKSCLQCKEEQQEAYPCQGYDDRLCCHDNQVASLDPVTNKFQCEDYYYCDQNQYYERHTQSCHKCPPDTYQLLVKHRNSYCMPCHAKNSSFMFCGINIFSSNEGYSITKANGNGILFVMTAPETKDSSLSATKPNQNDQDTLGQDYTRQHNTTTYPPETADSELDLTKPVLGLFIFQSLIMYVFIILFFEMQKKQMNPESSDVNKFNEIMYHRSLRVFILFILSFCICFVVLLTTKDRISLLVVLSLSISMSIYYLLIWWFRDKFRNSKQTETSPKDASADKLIKETATNAEKQTDTDFEDSKNMILNQQIKNTKENTRNRLNSGRSSK